MANDDDAKLAVALRYDNEKDSAPRVVASGRERIADQIIALAKEHGIEIRRDKELVQILGELDVDSLIPLEAYASVAEILSYLYRKNSELVYGLKQ